MSTLDLRVKSLPDYTTRSTCRVCGSSQLISRLSLGEQYVSDFLEPECHEIGNENGDLVKCPIELVQCQHCSLVQLRHTARQDFLYTRHYWYKSGTTETMKLALKNVVDAACRAVKLQFNDIVLDIGSNDGTLLRQYESNRIRRVGVEPATNLALEGCKGLDYFINDFWSYQKYCEYLSKPAKIITAIGMFYDLENPNQFIADVASALAIDGVFIAQLMCLGNMLNTNDIGNLTHEHLEYYSLESLEYLLGQHKLEIYDVETNSVNGESYRFFIRHVGSEVKSDSPKAAARRIHDIRLQEARYNNSQYWQTFQAAVEENKRKVVAFIEKVVSEGKQVWVYGASTKGNVILQYYGLDNRLITGAADKSEEKWGKVAVGSNIAIYSSEWARQFADYFLVLPYAFFNEFHKNETEWLAKGGKFVVPLPEMRVVG